MRLFYFPPLKLQYYFPKQFSCCPVFSTFYQPYTATGRLLWYIWCKMPLFRGIFSVRNLEKILPLEIIMRYTTSTTVLAFNKGTPGPEQKITILGFEFDTKTEFFLKYASSQIARINVSNEASVLRQLSHLDFVPSLLLHIEHPEYTLIKTTVLEGNRLVHQAIDNRLLDILILLSKQQVETNRSYAPNSINCFGHGDFCPWNMMLCSGQIRVYDWEMAGQYPLGYDLFTYIFQTSFLLHPRTEIKILLKENSGPIRYYFSCFGQINWQHFLLAFATVKLKNESAKQNKRLIKAYQQLKEYAEKL